MLTRHGQTVWSWTRAFLFDKMHIWSTGGWDANSTTQVKDLPLDCSLHTEKNSNIHFNQFIHINHLKTVLWFSNCTLLENEWKLSFPVGRVDMKSMEMILKVQACTWENLGVSALEIDGKFTSGNLVWLCLHNEPLTHDSTLQLRKERRRRESKDERSGGGAPRYSARREERLHCVLSYSFGSQKHDPEGRSHTRGTAFISQLHIHT